MKQFRHSAVGTCSTAKEGTPIPVARGNQQNPQGEQGREKEEIVILKMVPFQSLGPNIFHLLRSRSVGTFCTCISSKFSICGILLTIKN